MEADLRNLEIRAKVLREIRAFLDARGFVEVETPVRIAAPAPETHIDCPPVATGGYLRASPELQMKKLLALGMDRLYQIGPCFREGERGSRHNPEFTMIEWYRKDATYLDIKDDLEWLLAELHVSCPTSCVPKEEGRETLDWRRHFVTLRVREAYLRFAGWDPWEGDWDQDRFDFDMAMKIEPAIKEMGGGVFLMDYPPQAASLAKLSIDSNSPATNHQPPTTNHQSPGTNHQSPSTKHPAPSTKHQAPGTKHQAPGTIYAERWEFYYDGMELANCFTELCDEAEQTRRFEQAKAERATFNEADYPIDSAFLQSLPLIGSAAGVALGVDRLVMVLTKAKDIASVRVID